MPTYSKQLLSGSTNGRGILVAATATAGTLIHTAVSGTSSLDEIWLYAHNTSATAVKLTIEWGGVTSPNDLIEVTIPVDGTGLVLVAPGLLLQNGLVVRAFAGTANVLNIFGYVNRIV
jgi:hypothetical protein